MEREGLKGCCVCIGPEKGKEEAAPAAKAPTVAELIDELPLGRFHAFHIARQISQNCCVAVTLELVPYIVPGIQEHFHTSGTAATYAALFTAGSIFGAGMASLQDSLGRRPVIRAGAFFAMFFSFMISAIPNYTMILILRFLLGAAFSFQQYGFGTWFAEFLPRVNRGPLWASLTAGVSHHQRTALLCVCVHPSVRPSVSGATRACTLLRVAMPFLPAAAAKCSAPGGRAQATRSAEGSPFWSRRPSRKISGGT